MRHTLGGLGETQNRQDPSMEHISRTLPQSVNGKLTKQASKPKFQEARLKLKKLRLGLQRQLLKTGTALYLFIIKLHYSQNNWVNPFKRLLTSQRHLAVFRSCISATKCTKAFFPFSVRLPTQRALLVKVCSWEQKGSLYWAAVGVRNARLDGPL